MTRNFLTNGIAEEVVLAQVKVVGVVLILPLPLQLVLSVALILSPVSLVNHVTEDRQWCLLDLIRYA